MLGPAYGVWVCLSRDRKCQAVAGSFSGQTTSWEGSSDAKGQIGLSALAWCVPVSSLPVYGMSRWHGGTGRQEGAKTSKSRYSLESNVWSQEIANKNTQETSHLSLKYRGTTSYICHCFAGEDTFLECIHSNMYGEPELGWMLGGKPQFRAAAVEVDHTHDSWLCHVLPARH